MDSIPQIDLPKIVGLMDIPTRARESYKRSPERTELVQQVLQSLQPGKAVAVECPSLAEMQTFRCHLLVLRKGQVKTSRKGLTLYVTLKVAQLSFLEEEHGSH